MVEPGRWEWTTDHWQYRRITTRDSKTGWRGSDKSCVGGLFGKILTQKGRVTPIFGLGVGPDTPSVLYGEGMKSLE